MSDEPVVDAPLGSEENPMTQEQAVEAGVDVETVMAEAEPLQPEAHSEM